MIRRCAPFVVFCLLALAAIVATIVSPSRADGPPTLAPMTVTVTRTVTSMYRGHSAVWWASVSRRRARQLYRANKANALLRHRWQPTVVYALRLASAVYGIPYSDLATVSHCESTWNPYAANGRQLGLFQLGWRPFGFSPFDPVANALSAAATVRHDGSWRQWVCKP